MDPGLLQLFAVASPTFSVDSLEKEIWEEVEKLREQTLSAEEVGKAKKQARSYFLQGLQTLFSKGLLAGLYQVRAGDFRNIDSLLDRYESVTPDDVFRVARQYLCPENRTVVTLQPISQKEHEQLGEVE
jgi:predicted Zn-dependent peptidase